MRPLAGWYTSSKDVARFASVVLCLTVGTARAGAQVRSDTLATRVDAVFADINSSASPGCALGVIRNGALVYARGYGMADLGEDVALSPASAFYIASTSKQFTAASILLLAQEGKLSLDDEVRKYIPELPDYGTRLTINHLVHHTGGLRDYLGLLMGLGAGRAENVMSDDDIIALIARQKALNFVPGAEYSYSNSGYFLLGQIVKRVTGTSLREYADQRIFRPLGMLHTHFHDDRLQSIHRRAIGYDRGPDGFRIDFYGNFQGVGDGGLWSTVEDLAIWDRNFYDPLVGGSAFVKAQLTPGRLTSGDTLTYASGLALGRYRGLATVSHGGAFMGYRTEFLRFPEQRFSVICLCNLSSANPTARARKVADIFLATQFPRPGGSDSVRAEYPVELAASTLDALAGTYRNPSSGMIFPLTVEDRRLTTNVFGAPLPLAALDATHFRGVNGPVPLDVMLEPTVAGRGQRLRVSIGLGAKPELFERIPPLVLSRAQLAEYTGEYTSDELHATYAFAVSGDSLTVAIPNRPRIALAPTVRDAFVGDEIGFTFMRDKAGRLTGLVVWAAQDRNLRLQRSGRSTVR